MAPGAPSTMKNGPGTIRDATGTMGNDGSCACHYSSYSFPSKQYYIMAQEALLPGQHAKQRCIRLFMLQISQTTRA